MCEMCLCLARGAMGGEGDERIGFGLYQSWGNKGSVGRVSVFGLWWCMRGMGKVLGPGSEGVGCFISVCLVSPDSLCRWQVQVSVYCARPVYLRCTQCLTLLHFIDICFLRCNCLWHISAWPACPKHGKLVPHGGGREVLTQFAWQFITTVTAPMLVGCVVWSLSYIFILFIPMWDKRPHCHFSTFYGLERSLVPALKSDPYRTVRL